MIACFVSLELYYDVPLSITPQIYSTIMISTRYTMIVYYSYRFCSLVSPLQSFLTESSSLSGAHRETKERQWKRPAGTVLMNTAALTASHAQSAASLTRSTGGGNSNGNLQSLADAPNSTSSNRSGGSATAITRNAAKKQLDHGDEDEEDSLLASLDAPRTSATALSLLQRQSMRATSMRLQAGESSSV